LRFSSGNGQADRAIRVCNDYLRRKAVPNYLDICIVIKELINNAVHHGNKNRQDREVKCRLSFNGAERLHIEVEDEGEGFDHGALDLDIPADPRTMRNRGLAIAAALSHKIEFNGKGNFVKALIDKNVGSDADQRNPGINKRIDKR
jgi:anti-sigma regulatory factor (Ser/Thr protein kinase)